jgi:hypothetical protein
MHHDYLQLARFGANGLSYLKDPVHYSPHLEVLFELAVKRLVAVRQAFIPLQHGDLNDFKFKYLFAVEVAVEVLANVLCDSVIAEVKEVVEVDRLDRLLLGWVEVSDCHHLTNPTQPLLMLARYLHGISRRPRLPGTYNKLVDGSQDVAASRHTATAGIAAVACVIVTESMRDGVWDGQGWVLRYLEQVLERLAATEAKHWSFRGGTARDKCGSLSGLASTASTISQVARCQYHDQIFSTRALQSVASKVCASGIGRGPNDSSSITPTSDPSSRHRSHPISSTGNPDLVQLPTHRYTAPLPVLHARLCTRMRPPGFLSIALRRGSNASQSSVEDDSRPTTPGPTTAPRSPGFDNQGEAGTVHAHPSATSKITATTLSTTGAANRPVPHNQAGSRLRPNLDPDLDLESKLEAADRKAKESVKVHYFPKDKPVYSCRKCLVPIVRHLLRLYLHRHHSSTDLSE